CASPPAGARSAKYFASPLIEESGLRISWATPAARCPSATSFSLRFISSCNSWRERKYRRYQKNDNTLASMTVARAKRIIRVRSEEHTSELQSRFDLVCRLL